MGGSDDDPDFLSDDISGITPRMSFLKNCLDVEQRGDLCAYHSTMVIMLRWTFSECGQLLQSSSSVFLADPLVLLGIPPIFCGFWSLLDSSIFLRNIVVSPD